MSPFKTLSKYDEDRSIVGGTSWNDTTTQKLIIMGMHVLWTIQVYITTKRLKDIFSELFFSFYWWLRYEMFKVKKEI